MSESTGAERLTGASPEDDEGSVSGDDPEAVPAVDDVELEADYGGLRDSSVYEPGRGPLIRRVLLIVVLTGALAAGVFFAEDLLAAARQTVEAVSRFFE